MCDSLSLDEYRVLTFFQFYKGSTKASLEEHMPLYSETVFDNYGEAKCFSLSLHPNLD